jgi:hypothetical protein
MPLVDCEGIEVEKHLRFLRPNFEKEGRIALSSNLIGSCTKFEETTQAVLQAIHTAEKTQSRVTVKSNIQGLLCFNSVTFGAVMISHILKEVEVPMKQSVVYI